MYWRIVVLASCSVLIPVAVVSASDGRYDRSIEAAAAKIAASKLGEIRGPISYDETPVTTRPSKPKLKVPAPMPDPMKISIYHNDLVFSDGLDKTTTAGIKLRMKQNQWERFDSKGRPIN